MRKGGTLWAELLHTWRRSWIAGWWLVSWNICVTSISPRQRQSKRGLTGNFAVKTSIFFQLKWWLGIMKVIKRGYSVSFSHHIELMLLKQCRLCFKCSSWSKILRVLKRSKIKIEYNLHRARQKGTHVRKTLVEINQLISGTSFSEHAKKKIKQTPQLAGRFEGTRHAC